MSDLKLDINDEKEIDIVFDGVDLQLTNDLETSVIISVFTNRRAANDDTLPNQGVDRMGCWMDTTWDDPGDEMGSKLWLLEGRKIDNQLYLDAKAYSEESLQWMVQDKVALRVVAQASRLSEEEIFLQIKITRPDGITEEFKYFYNWEAQAARRAT